MTNTAPESLVQLFSDKRALLRQQLAEKPGIDQAAGILRNFILSLFTEYSRREKDEQRVAIIQSLAGSVAEAAQLLLGASKSTVWETPSNKVVDLLPAAPERDHSRWVLPLIRLLVTAGFKPVALFCVHRHAGAHPCDCGIWGGAGSADCGVYAFPFAKA